MLARILIRLRPGVLDPQGVAIEGALKDMGFPGIHRARAGKVIELELDEQPEESARSLVDRLCRELLANPVLEDFSFTLHPGRPPGSPPAVEEPGR